MPSFGEVLLDIQKLAQAAPSDVVRRRSIRKLHELTKRNVVIYYSSFLTQRGPEHYFTVQINDEDKHGFMSAFAGMDFSRGLDLVLHTPGGDVAAAESIIEYLRSKFGSDIRVIVPQISMSGGTLIALAGKSIVMGRHSNLGPIDPQLGNMPAISILKEFETAKAEITQNPALAAVWYPILQKYEPTLLSRAKQGIDWTREIAQKALRDGALLSAEDKGNGRVDEIVEFLLSSDVHKAHGRHIHRDELAQRGLTIVNLEDEAELQDAVLTLHHASMISMSNYGVLKIIENHTGVAHMKLGMQLAVPFAQFPQMIPAPMQPRPVPAPAPAPAPTPASVPAPPPKLSLATRIKWIWKLLRSTSAN